MNDLRFNKVVPFDSMDYWSRENSDLLGLGFLAYWTVGAVLTGVIGTVWIATFVIFSSIIFVAGMLLRDLLR
jgi:hypothetical protein